MKLKKPISILLSVLMVLSCLTCAIVPISAAENQLTVTPTAEYLTTEAKTVAVGEQVEISFLLPEKMNVLNFDLGLNYDTEKLSYVSYTSPCSGVTLNPNGKSYNVVCNSSTAYGTEIDAGEALITFTFEALAAGEAAVNLSMVDFKKVVFAEDGTYTDYAIFKNGEFVNEEPATEDVVVVAGSNTELFGTSWDGTNTDNLMTKDGDVYTKTYTVDKAYSAVQLKAVVNGADWIGDKDGQNLTFDLTGAGTFTVTYDPNGEGFEGAGLVTVTGDIVAPITEFKYETVIAAGNGDGEWLNGADWDPAYIDNEMTEIADDVWEIEFTDVTEGFERQIKFAIDGAWTHNFGLNGDETFEVGKVMTAEYNGDNISFDTPDYEYNNVRVVLDLSNFDFTTKKGATYVIYVTNADAVMGDVNSDGVFDANDVTTLQRYVARFMDAEIDETVADCNGDGKINVRDVTAMQRALAGIEDFNISGMEDIIIS